MKKIFVLAISLLMTAAPIAAQQHGGSPKPVKLHAAPAPKTSTHVAAPHSGPTTHGSAAPKAPKTTYAGGHAAPKTTVHAAPVKATKAPKPLKPAKTTTTVTTTKHAKTATIVPALPLTKVQQKLQSNTNLASKLQSRLPAGTNLTLASSGFRNLGQFVAAVNVSNNLGIPFWQLKSRMVDQGMSLGQAIQDTRPRTTDTIVVARRAETDADVLIRTTEQTTLVKSKKAKSTHGER